MGFLAFHPSFCLQITVNCQCSPFSSMLPTKLSSAKLKMSFLRSETWPEHDLHRWYITWIGQAPGFCLLEQEYTNSSTIFLSFAQPIAHHAMSAGVISNTTSSYSKGVRGSAKPLLEDLVMQPSFMMLCSWETLVYVCDWLTSSVTNGSSLKLCWLSCHRKSTPAEQTSVQGWQVWEQCQVKITYTLEVGNGREVVPQWSVGHLPESPVQYSLGNPRCIPVISQHLVLELVSIAWMWIMKAWRLCDNQYGWEKAALHWQWVTAVSGVRKITRSF